MKLKTYFDEFIAITIVFFIIATFALATRVRGQDSEEPAPAATDEPSLTVPADGVELEVVDPSLTAVATSGKVILNPGQEASELENRGDVINPVVVAEDQGRIAVLRDSLNIADTRLGDRILLESDILFDFDKATVKPSADETLGQVAEFIQLSGDREVEIVGYADHIGNEEYNLDLSWRRSKAIIEHLVTEEDIPRARLRAVGRGEEGAEAPNDDPDGSDNPEGRERNRRVEILIRNGIDASGEKPGPELN